MPHNTELGFKIRMRTGTEMNEKSKQLYTLAKISLRPNSFCFKLKGLINLDVVPLKISLRLNIRYMNSAIPFPLLSLLFYVANILFHISWLYFYNWLTVTLYCTFNTFVFMKLCTVFIPFDISYLGFPALHPFPVRTQNVNI